MDRGSAGPHHPDGLRSRRAAYRRYHVGSLVCALSRLALLAGPDYSGRTEDPRARDIPQHGRALCLPTAWPVGQVVHEFHRLQRPRATTASLPRATTWSTGNSPAWRWASASRASFDHGGCVIGAFLYDSYDIRAPRVLKRRDSKFWTLYGAYPRQGGYELRPGYEGVAMSDDGLTLATGQGPADPIGIGRRTAARGRKAASTSLGWWSMRTSSTTSTTRLRVAWSRPDWPSQPIC